MQSEGTPKNINLAQGLDWMAAYRQQLAMPTISQPVTLESEMPGMTENTVLMLKGVPTEYSREKLMEVLKRWMQQVDFIFIPGAAQGTQNRGHAFINFTGESFAQEFTKEFADKKQSECFPDAATPGEEKDKVCTVQKADREKLVKSIERHQIQSLELGDGSKGAWDPVRMDTDGKEKKFSILSSAVAGHAVKQSSSSKSFSQTDPTSPSMGKKGGKQKKQQDGAGKGGKSPAAAASPYGTMYPGYPYGFSQYLLAYQMQVAHAQQAQAQSWQRLSGIRKQIDFYYSSENLHRDEFMKSLMDIDGWVPLSKIVSWKKMRALQATPEEVCFALQSNLPLDANKPKPSVRIQVDNKKMALRLSDQNATEREQYVQQGVQIRAAAEAAKAKEGEP